MTTDVAAVEVCVPNALDRFIESGGTRKVIG